MRRRVKLNEEKDSFEKIKEDINKRKKFERKVKRRRILRRFLKLAAVFLLFFLIIRYDQWEGSRLQSVLVSGNDLLSKEEIKEMAKVDVDDRMVLTFTPMIKKRVMDNPFIKSVEVELFRSEGMIIIHVLEEEPIAYEVLDGVNIYFDNAEKMPIDLDKIHGIEGLVLLSNIVDDELKKEIALQLGTLNEGSRLAISEIIHKGEKHDEDALLLIMNHGYYVYSNVETLPLLDNYATIISGANPENKCIHLLEYGPTEDTQVATVKPCDFEQIENDEEE